MTETAHKTIRLLVVSREPSVLHPLASIGKSKSWHLETATSGWEAMERVQSGVGPDLLVLDLPSGDGDSLHILRWLRRLRPDLPIVVLCYPDDSDRRKEATRLGAEDVLVRPFDEAQLESVIRRHLGSAGNGEVEIASENVEQIGQDAFFVSATPVMQKLRAQAELLAQADVPVLILGEKGTGKDTVARLIHKLSVRSGFQFLKVNCAAMPGDLLEVELFGTERSSFATGVRTSAGKLELGRQGTVLLDEITEMPAGLQAKLVHFMQNNEFRRPGDAGAISADVRILASTSANLDRALAQKKLREDLYYRLSAFTVHVPPLRQRKDEIAILLRYLMHRMVRHYGLPAREFPATVLEACQQHDWPGNLGELETFVKRFLVAGHRDITLSEMQLASQEPHTDPSIPSHEAMGAAITPDEEKSGPAQAGQRSLKSLVQRIKCEAERNAISAALEKTGWNRKAAARDLKVSYRTLLYKIEQYRMTASVPSLSQPFEGFAFHANGTKGQGR